MSKLAPASIKYIIKATIKAKGVIEKPDVIGAIFGQTEGLLGSDLDLREMQRSGRIGRIEVNIKSSQGKSNGEVIIPSSLDSSETSMIAASLETIDRIGPCKAEIQLKSIEDTRAEKREYVVTRAKDILETLMKTAPETSEMSEHVKEAVRTAEISTYHGLPCGPALLESEEIIVVEGRADVIHLLKFGIKNAIAMEGTSIPQTIFNLAKEKTVTLFVDDDRGGQLIVKEFMQNAKPDYIAIAPEGKEVEELSKKETYKALRDKVPAEGFTVEKRIKSEPKNPRAKQAPPAKQGGFVKKPSKPYARTFPTPKPTRVTPKQKEMFKKTLEELVGTRAACILNEKGDTLGRVPVAELPNALRTVENPHTVIFDGKVDFKLNAIARTAGVVFLVGMEKENFRSPVTILCRKDL